MASARDASPYLTPAASELDVLDRRTDKALAAVAGVLPASMTGGLPADRPKPRKAALKRRAAKASK